MDASSEGFALIVLAIGLFLLVVAVLWVLLPFAVFGMKAKLDFTNQQLAEIKVLLREIAQAARRDEAGSKPSENTDWTRADADALDLPSRRADSELGDRPTASVWRKLEKPGGGSDGAA